MNHLKIAAISLCAAALCAAPPPNASSSDETTFLIRNATIHPVTGPNIAKGSILVVDGKIKEVGPAVKPVGKIKIIDATGLHVWPGLIDSGTNLGQEEISSIRESGDTVEIGDFDPQLRAIVAVNPASEHIPVTRANGITNAIVTVRGGTIGGQAALLSLDGWTWEEMNAKGSAAVSMDFPAIRSSGRGAFGGAGLGAAPRPYADLKKEYDEKLLNLNNFFDEARRYQKAKDANRPDFRPNNRLEAMLPILERRTPMLVSAQLEREIGEAIKFANAQKIKIVLTGVRDPGKAIEQIKSNNIPVVLGPTLALPLHEDDAFDEAYALPAEMYKAGIMFSFASNGNQFARNLPYQAANAVGFGLPYEEALKAVTINAAKIWGVDDQMGSIEPGKLANLVIADGDILEARTNIKQLFIKGHNVSLSNKHVMLYERYKARPEASPAAPSK